MMRLQIRECISTNFMPVSATNLATTDLRSSVFAVFKTEAPNAFCGLVTNEDVLLHPNATFGDIVLQHPLPTLTMETSAKRALSIMKHAKTHILPVIDIKNRIIGVLTYINLISALYQHTQTLLLHVLQRTKQRNQARMDRRAVRKNQLLFPKINSFTSIHSRIKSRITQNITKKQGTIFIIDLDDFGAINTLQTGSACADILLKDITLRLRRTLGPNDLLIRQGDDEFVLIIYDIDLNETTKIASRLLKILASPFVANNQTFHLTASIGINYPSNTPQTPDSQLTNANIALYEAKQRGKNNHQIFIQEMGEKITYQQLLETHMYNALERGELFLCYQPIIESRCGQIVAMEALLRWKSPELGMILPNDFIPIAEKTGLIISIGAWVLREACLQAAYWQNINHSLRVTVNVSAFQFQGVTGHAPELLIEHIQAALDESHLDASLLEVEITENSLLKEQETSIAIMHKIKALGVRISCDDFGTGYSSLNYLKNFPLDTLKIDKTFIDNINQCSVDIAIIRTIITLAHQLNLDVIAEGVENMAQLLILQQLGCAMIQGYYYSKPITQEAATIKLMK